MKQIKLSEIIGGGYNEFWNFKGRYLVCKGSRGSKKSKTTALKIVFNMLKYPLSNALVVRQVFNTHRDSTWKELQWAAEVLGVRNDWTFTVSPLEATYKPTGQKIYFRGLDNPLSITSITVAVGSICWCWFEEAYQVINEEDFNKIDMSIRGILPTGYYRQIIMTFNPWSDKHWLKRRFFDVPDDENKLALTTTYRCNEWLDKEYLKIFEEMRERNPRRYRIEGDGEWGISEGLIFDNWRQEKIDREAISQLPYWLGLDFGWKDPTAISICKVDKENKKLYLVEEFYKSEQTIDKVAEWLKYKGYQKCEIMCDSAEPRSIVELNKNGIMRAKAAKKGAGSIMEGIRKLQEYEIIVDDSCENAIIEFSNYCFDKDKTGNWTDKPIDAFCHIIDSMRYAIQCDNNNKMTTISKSALGL